MSEPISPYVLTNENSPAFWLIDNLWMPMAGSFVTNGKFCFLEQVCGPGLGGPPHTHEQDEAIYISEGEITMILGSDRISAKAGALIYIPAHCVHSFRIDSDQARLLNFCLPGGFEQVITRFGVPATSRALPASDVKSIATLGQMKAVLGRLGINTVAVPDSLRWQKEETIWIAHASRTCLLTRPARRFGSLIISGCLWPPVITRRTTLP